MTDFWSQLETKQITDRATIEEHLTKKLGKPTNQLATNCLEELTKKINSYYLPEEPQNYTTHSLIGSVSQISERIRKTGKRKGQVDYDLKLTSQETLQARKEDLPEDKWNQITKMALLGKNLVFKYKKWITNRQIIDFYPAKN